MRGVSYIYNRRHTKFTVNNRACLRCTTIDRSREHFKSAAASIHAIKNVGLSLIIALLFHSIWNFRSCKISSDFHAGWEDCDTVFSIFSSRFSNASVRPFQFDFYFYFFPSFKTISRNCNCIIATNRPISIWHDVFSTSCAIDPSIDRSIGRSVHRSLYFNRCNLLRSIHDEMRSISNAFKMRKLIHSKPWTCHGYAI